MVSEYFMITMKNLLDVIVVRMKKKIYDYLNNHVAYGLSNHMNNIGLENLDNYRRNKLKKHINQLTSF